MFEITTLINDVLSYFIDDPLGFAKLDMGYLCLEPEVTKIAKNQKITHITPNDRNRSVLDYKELDFH